MPPPPAPGTQDENSPSHSTHPGSTTASQYDRRRPLPTDADDTPPIAASPSKKVSRPERVLPWPSHIPTNGMLIGTSRSKLQPVRMARLRAQEHIDPDFFFAQPLDDFPLQQIFGKYPEAAKLVQQIRGVSGDWRIDTFTEQEEIAYKEALGYSTNAPLQFRGIHEMQMIQHAPPQ